MSAGEIVDEIERLFVAKGGESYGEGITQLQHAEQAAACAKAEGASASLIAAALLHDVGHLIQQVDDKFGYHKHDKSGADYLAQRFGPEISEPVRLHVAAKRYLVATDPAYAKKLSAASTYTLSKQGGPMSAEEVRAFESNPHFREAVRLRTWDDLGKIEGLHVPAFKDYRGLLESLAQK